MPNLGIDILFNGNSMMRLLVGLSVTLKIALFTIVLSWIFGIILGVLRTTKSIIIRATLRGYLEVFRAIPILVWLYLLYYTLSINSSINLPPTLVSIIVFTLWGSSEMSDIVRSSLISLPPHQRESGQAIGLNRFQLFFYVLIPQALLLMIPPAINLSVRMIMTTALLFTIGVVELIKVGQQLIESEGLTNPMAPFWIYGFILFIYFMICYPLSQLAKWIVKRNTGGAQ